MHACTVCCPCCDTTGGVIDHYWDKQTLSVSQVLPWTVYQFPAIHTFRWVRPKNRIIPKKYWCLSIVYHVITFYHHVSSSVHIFPLEVATNSGLTSVSKQLPGVSTRRRARFGSNKLKRGDCTRGAWNGATYKSIVDLNQETTLQCHQTLGNPLLGNR
jgi:hypothetical protein